MISKWKQNVWKYLESQICGHQKKLSGAQKIFFDDVRLWLYQSENRRLKESSIWNLWPSEKALRFANSVFWWYLILMIFNLKHTVSKYHQPEISDHKINSQRHKRSASTTSAFDDIQEERDCLKVSSVWNLYLSEKFSGGKWSCFSWKTIVFRLSTKLFPNTDLFLQEIEKFSLTAFFILQTVSTNEKLSHQSTYNLTIYDLFILLLKNMTLNFSCCDILCTQNTVWLSTLCTWRAFRIPWVLLQLI